MNKIIFLILVLFHTYIIAQVTNGPKENYAGSVQSVEYTTYFHKTETQQKSTSKYGYEYDRFGNELFMWTPSMLGAGMTYFGSVYNDSNQCTFGFELLKKDTLGFIHYHYNSSGLIIKEISFDQTHKQIQNTVYTYDSSGNCIAKICAYDQSKDTLAFNMTYDSLGHCSTLTIEDYGRATKTETYVYNSDGLMIRVHSPCNQNHETCTVEHAYDGKQRLIETRHNNSKNITIYFCYIEYNEQGDIISEMIEDRGHSFIRISEYIYDDVGNWVTQTIYLNGTLVETTSREFIYFN